MRKTAYEFIMEFIMEVNGIQWSSSLIAVKLFLYLRTKASTQHNLKQLFQINSLKSKFELVPALSYYVKSR